MKTLKYIRENENAKIVLAILLLVVSISVSWYRLSIGNGIMHSSTILDIVIYLVCSIGGLISFFILNNIIKREK
ncbi:hypothetical protein D3C81_07210 [compost metagenome]